MIDSTLLRFNNNIYPRCHRKTRANKNNFAAFFKFSSIKYIIRRNNNTNRNFFVKLINNSKRIFLFIISKKTIIIVEQKDFSNYVYFFDLIDSELKKTRFYGSKRKINRNCIIFSYYEFII